MSKKITRDQINAINAKMSNGYRLDLRHYAMWGEKQACKRIDLRRGVYLMATFTFRTSFKEERNAWGQRFNVPNGMQHIALHLAIWEEGEHADTSHGLGQWISVSEDMPRKSFAAIQKLTADYPEDVIMSLLDERQHVPGILYAC